MKIAFDLDEVVFDWLGDFFDFINGNWDRLNLSDTSVDPAICEADGRNATEWNFFQTKYNMDRPTFMRIYNDYCDNGGFARCITVSSTIGRDITKLREEGHELIYVTSRPPRTIFDTETALNVNGIPFDRIYHCSGYLGQEGAETQRIESKRPEEAFHLPDLSTKADVYRAEKPDIVLDDNPEYLLEAVGAGVPKTILVTKRHNVSWTQANRHRFPLIKITDSGWKGTMRSLYTCINRLNEIKGVKSGN